MLARPNLTLDIVIPVFNEEEALPDFHAGLCAIVDQLSCTPRFYYVSDGSTDGTNAFLNHLAAEDKRVEVIELSRNFGHQAALTAGLDCSTGDAVITMDGDGQHPASMIPQMLDLYCSGYEVVLTQRLEQRDLPKIKRITSSAFYWFLNRMGDTRVLPGSADFRLLSRPVVEALKGMREYHRFLRGMVAWMGYRTVILPYTPPERLAGKSKYSVKKMLRLAGDAIFSFSLIPLQLGILLGGIFLGLAVLEALYVTGLWVFGFRNVLAPGWSSLMFMLLIVGGTLMIILSFIGIYVGLIFQEVKGRPIYLIRRRQSDTAGTPGADSPR